MLISFTGNSLPVNSLLIDLVQVQI